MESIAKQNNLSVEDMKKKVFSEGNSFLRLCVYDLCVQGGRAGSLKGDFLDPEEVANAVLYVSSALSTATNGSVVRAEGGILQHI